jgi:hypothetical protein
MNWMCPVDGPAEVWSSPVAALSHVYHSDGNGHGEQEEIDRHDGKTLWPEPTEEEANQDTVREEVERQLAGTFGDDVGEMIRRAENDGFELPMVLNDHDVESFKIMEAFQGPVNDLAKIREELDRIDQAISAALKNWPEGASPSDGIDVKEPEPEPDPEPSGSGRFTTSEVKEREEEEVISVLERSTLLDDYNDHLLEIFELVYKQRDNSDNVKIDDIVSETGAPNPLVEDNLEKLKELNMIRHDENNDSFYVPY